MIMKFKVKICLAVYNKNIKLKKIVNVNKISIKMITTKTIFLILITFLNKI